VSLGFYWSLEEATGAVQAFATLLEVRDDSLINRHIDALNEAWKAYEKGNDDSANNDNITISRPKM